MSLFIDYNHCRPVYEHYGRKEERYFLYPAESPRYFLKCYTGNHPQIPLWYEEEQKRMFALTQAGKVSGKTQLFPRYYEASFAGGPYCHMPLLCMDFLPGISLRDFYDVLIHNQYGKTHDISREAIWYLDAQTVCHICTQVFQMLKTLSGCGIWYLDLNPGNLIIRNDRFDLTLVDHTFCLYTPADSRLDAGMIRRSCLRSLVPSYEHDPFTPENHLTEAYALFAASLFFGGRPEKLPAFYRSKLLWLLDSAPIPETFFWIYPASGTEAKRLETFFHDYPTLDSFHEAFMKGLHAEMSSRANTPF